MNIGLVYASLFAVGAVYALLMAVLGSFGDHDLGGHFDGGEVGGGVDQPHPISGTVVATFITGFGGGGSIAHYFLGWSVLPGLLAATATGLVMAGAAFAVLELIFSRTQAGSEFVTSDSAGRTAEVITTIPAGGSGEVAYLVKGQRERAAARSVDGQPIRKGTSVVIERMMGTTAHVRPQRELTEGG